MTEELRAVPIDPNILIPNKQAQAELIRYGIKTLTINGEKGKPYVISLDLVEVKQSNTCTKIKTTLNSLGTLLGDWVCRNKEAIVTFILIWSMFGFIVALGLK